MNVSTRARYSLRLMLEISRFSDGESPVSLQDVATWTGVSRRYLEQLIIPLKNGGLVKAKPGRSGGYCLTRDPATIRLGDIIGAATGPVALAECVDESAVCKRSARCECRNVWVLLTHRIREVLDEYSLADLTDPAKLAEMSEGVARRPALRRARRGEE